MPIKIDFKFTETPSSRNVEFRAEGDFDVATISTVLQLAGIQRSQLQEPAPMLLPERPVSKPKPRLVPVKKKEIDTKPEPLVLDVENFLGKPAPLAPTPIKTPYIAKGARFGNLTVIEDTFKSTERSKVRCTCGVEKTVITQTLKQGKAKSCGNRACRVVSGPIEPVSHRRIKPNDISDDDLRNMVMESHAG